MHDALTGGGDVLVRSGSGRLDEGQGSIILCTKFAKTQPLAWVLLVENREESTLGSLREDGLTTIFLNTLQRIDHINRLEDMRRKEVGEALSLNSLAEFAHDAYGPAISASIAIKLVLLLAKELSPENKQRLQAALQEATRVEAVLKQGTNPQFLKDDVLVSCDPVDLKEIFSLINVQCEMLLSQRENIEFSAVNLLPEQTILESDHLKLDRIIGNLISNAIKYGEKSVNITMDSAEGEIIINFKDLGPWLSYRAKDGDDWQVFEGELTGRRERKFEYASVDDQGNKIMPHIDESRGLGLRSVLNIARAIKAKVFVRNLPKGKIISLELPLHHS